MPDIPIDELVAPHLEFADDGSSKGGNRGFTCVNCENHYTGSLTRQLAHLLGTKTKGIAACKCILQEDRCALQAAWDRIRKLRSDGSGHGSLYDSESGMSHPVFNLPFPAPLLLSNAKRANFCLSVVAGEAPKKRYKQQQLDPLLQSSQKAEFDDCAADLFYGTGIPLHLCRYVSSTFSPAADCLGLLSSCFP